MEDARFVRFVEGDGRVRYLATYSAFNGHDILPMLLETNDFCSFTMCPLLGNACRNKGMALFPRRIDGHYQMITRSDGENLYVARSDNLYSWDYMTPLAQPKYDWESIQIGNCGAPIETEKGWILLTHGVGPMRTSSIGAMLLDQENPQKVIGRLAEPLLVPSESEREGYVPNVVYSCGAMLCGKMLVIPYAYSDSASGIAVVPVDDLINACEGLEDQR